ncbi:succinyl-CoA ligase [ADP-forming] subunit beta [Striga asiatica]|uniref:Succinyl-CoA ligase [ADP-forming] subunit beta n=1 Tax=Striga asiatica TaxID=4170 RepID=A0A5A7QBB3_STRAF|nr:succinyl-CoA ligase [ADP-forming] subunit beta [Striga asiatica]
MAERKADDPERADLAAASRRPPSGEWQPFTANRGPPVGQRSGLPARARPANKGFCPAEGRGAAMEAQRWSSADPPDFKFNELDEVLGIEAAQEWSSSAAPHKSPSSSLLGFSVLLLEGNMINKYEPLWGYS